MIRSARSRVRSPFATVAVVMMMLVVLVGASAAQVVDLQPVDIEVEGTPTDDAPTLDPSTRLLQESPSTPEDVPDDGQEEAPIETSSTPGMEVLQIAVDAMLGVYVWVCPAGFVLDTLANAQLACNIQIDGVVVDLDAADASEPDLQGVTGASVVYFDQVTPGTWAIQPQVPAGYTDPAILYCDDLNDPTAADPILQGGAYHEIDLAEGDFIECHWIIVEDNDNHTVRVTKAVCPEGTDTTADYWSLVAACGATMADVTFTLATEGGSISQATDANGRAEWTNVDLGPGGSLTLAETIPAGFGEPTVWCVDYPEAAADPIDYVWFPVVSIGGLVGPLFPEQHEPFIFECTFFNSEGDIPSDDPDLTLHKWTCPPGYDPDAATADPLIDCTIATDGIEFEVSNDDLAMSFTGTTGGAGNGTVTFADLPPGEWVVSETVPAGTMRVFSLPCTGFVQPYLQPLRYDDPQMSVFLEVGDHVTCHWFNVPEPDGGTVVLTKYICATEVFVSEVECQIEEGGVTFDLLDQNGTVIATATTDAVGRITWTGLAPGDYWVAEHGATWCRIQASPSEGGDSFGVNAGMESVVNVWNCGAEPGNPGETPTTFPNTGVGPAAQVPERRTP